MGNEYSQDHIGQAASGDRSLSGNTRANLYIDMAHYRGVEGRMMDKPKNVFMNKESVQIRENQAGNFSNRSNGGNTTQLSWCHGEKGVTSGQIAVDKKTTKQRFKKDTSTGNLAGSAVKRSITEENKRDPFPPMKSKLNPEKHHSNLPAYNSPAIEQKNKPPQPSKALKTNQKDATNRGSNYQTKGMCGESNDDSPTISTRTVKNNIPSSNRKPNQENKISTPIAQPLKLSNMPPAGKEGFPAPPGFEELSGLDLSHLSAEERMMILQVAARAKQIEQVEQQKIRKIEDQVALYSQSARQNIQKPPSSKSTTAAERHPPPKKTQELSVISQGTLDANKTHNKDAKRENNTASTGGVGDSKTADLGSKIVDTETSGNLPKMDREKQTCYLCSTELPKPNKRADKQRDKNNLKPKGMADTSPDIGKIEPDTSPVKCSSCGFVVCSKCSVRSSLLAKGLLCALCAKQRELVARSNLWLKSTKSSQLYRSQSADTSLNPIECLPAKERKLSISSWHTRSYSDSGKRDFTNPRVKNKAGRPLERRTSKSDPSTHAKTRRDSWVKSSRRNSSASRFSSSPNSSSSSSTSSTRSSNTTSWQRSYSSRKPGLSPESEKESRKSPHRDINFLNSGSSSIGRPSISSVLVKQLSEDEEVKKQKGLKMNRDRTSPSKSMRNETHLRKTSNPLPSLSVTKEVANESENSNDKQSLNNSLRHADVGDNNEKIILKSASPKSNTEHASQPQVKPCSKTERDVTRGSQKDSIHDNSGRADERKKSRNEAEPKADKKKIDELEPSIRSAGGFEKRRSTEDPKLPRTEIAVKSTQSPTTRQSIVTTVSSGHSTTTTPTVSSRNGRKLPSAMPRRAGARNTVDNNTEVKSATEKDLRKSIEPPKVPPRKSSLTGVSSTAKTIKNKQDDAEPAILKESELDGTDSFFLAPACRNRNGDGKKNMNLYEDINSAADIHSAHSAMTASDLSSLSYNDSFGMEENDTEGDFDHLLRNNYMNSNTMTDPTSTGMKFTSMYDDARKTVHASQTKSNENDFVNNKPSKSTRPGHHLAQSQEKVHAKATGNQTNIGGSNSSTDVTRAKYNRGVSHCKEAIGPHDTKFCVHANGTKVGSNIAKTSETVLESDSKSKKMNTKPVDIRSTQASSETKSTHSQVLQVSSVQSENLQKNSSSYDQARTKSQSIDVRTQPARTQKDSIPVEIASSPNAAFDVIDRSEKSKTATTKFPRMPLPSTTSSSAYTVKQHTNGIVSSTNRKWEIDDHLSDLDTNIQDFEEKIKENMRILSGEVTPTSMTESDEEEELLRSATTSLPTFPVSMMAQRGFSFRPPSNENEPVASSRDGRKKPKKLANMFMRRTTSTDSFEELLKQSDLTQRATHRGNASSKGRSVPGCEKKKFSNGSAQYSDTEGESSNSNAVPPSKNTLSVKKKETNTDRRHSLPVPTDLPTVRPTFSDPSDLRTQGDDKVQADAQHPPTITVIGASLDKQDHTQTVQDNFGESLNRTSSQIVDKKLMMSTVATSTNDPVPSGGYASACGPGVGVLADGLARCFPCGTIATQAVSDSSHMDVHTRIVSGVSVGSPIKMTARERIRSVDSSTQVSPTEDVCSSKYLEGQGLSLADLRKLKSLIEALSDKSDLDDPRTLTRSISERPVPKSPIAKKSNHDVFLSPAETEQASSNQERLTNPRQGPLYQSLGDSFGLHPSGSGQTDSFAYNQVSLENPSIYPQSRIPANHPETSGQNSQFHRPSFWPHGYASPGGVGYLNQAYPAHGISGYHQGNVNQIPYGVVTAPPTMDQRHDPRLNQSSSHHYIQGLDYSRGMNVPTSPFNHSYQHVLPDIYSPSNTSVFQFEGTLYDRNNNINNPVTTQPRGRCMPSQGHQESGYQTQGHDIAVSLSNRDENQRINRNSSSCQSGEVSPARRDTSNLGDTPPNIRNLLTMANPGLNNLRKCASVPSVLNPDQAAPKKNPDKEPESNKRSKPPVTRLPSEDSFDMYETEEISGSEEHESYPHHQRRPQQHRDQRRRSHHRRNQSRFYYDEEDPFGFDYPHNSDFYEEEYRPHYRRASLHDYGLRQSRNYSRSPPRRPRKYSEVEPHSKYRLNHPHGHSPRYMEREYSGRRPYASSHYPRSFSRSSSIHQDFLRGMSRSSSRRSLPQPPEEDEYSWRYESVKRKARMNMSRSMSGAPNRQNDDGEMEVSRLQQTMEDLDQEERELDLRLKYLEIGRTRRPSMTSISLHEDLMQSRDHSLESFRNDPIHSHRYNPPSRLGSSDRSPSQSRLPRTSPRSNTVSEFLSSESNGVQADFAKSDRKDVVAHPAVMGSTKRNYEIVDDVGDIPSKGFQPANMTSDDEDSSHTKYQQAGRKNMDRSPNDHRPSHSRNNKHNIDRSAGTDYQSRYRRRLQENDPIKSMHRRRVMRGDSDASSSTDNHTDEDRFHSFSNSKQFPTYHVQQGPYSLPATRRFQYTGVEKNGIEFYDNVKPDMNSFDYNNNTKVRNIDSKSGYNSVKQVPSIKYSSEEQTAGHQAYAELVSCASPTEKAFEAGKMNNYVWIPRTRQNGKTTSSRQEKKGKESTQMQIMDTYGEDMRTVVSDSEAYYLGKETTNWFDKPDTIDRNQEPK